MRKHLILLLLGVTSISLCYGQRSTNSQALLNPSSNYTALSGYHGALQTNFHYRNQWPGIPSSAHSYNIGVDGYIHKLRSGVGFNIIHDRIEYGLIKRTEYEFHVAPKFQLGEETYLLTGVSANLTRGVIDLSKLPIPNGVIYPNANNLVNIDNYEALWLNASVGFGLLHKNIMFLAQSHYVTQTDGIQKFHDNTESRIPRTLNFYASRRFDVSSAVAISPSISYQRQAGFNSFLVGLNASLWNFRVGTMLEWQDRVVAQLGYAIAERVLISYSYDVTISSLRTQTLGSHEFGIRTTLFKDRAKKVYIQDLQLL